MLQQFAIIQRLQEVHGVRIAACRHDGVEQAGIVVADQMLLHRPARGAMADGEQRRTELLDEVLLDLGDGLGRFHVVIVGAHHVERAGRDRIAAGDEIVEKAGAQLLQIELLVGAGHPAEAAPHVVIGLDAAAEAVDQLAVPSRRGRARQRRRQCAGRGIVEDVDDIGGAVDDALFLADDERDVLAFGGPCGGDIGGARGLGVERFPLAALVAIEIRDHGRRRARGVGGRRQAVGLVLADERLLLRPGEQGAVDGMIDEGHGRFPAAGLDGQLIGADPRALRPGRPSRPWHRSGRRPTHRWRRPSPAARRPRRQF